MHRRLLSFRYAFQGLSDLFATQINARIHLTIGVAVFIAGCYLGLTTTEWCLIALCMALVIALEALNTALEYLTDLVSPEFHPLAGKAKDVAAAAVLVGAFGAVAVGLLIFLPKVVAMF